MADFINLQGLQAIWARTKEYVTAILKSTLTDRLGKANGIATLGADSKLTPSQLPTLKTVNGQSVVGSGDIAIDLSLYRVVSALPTTGIETNKIYLVIDPSAPEGNVYKEYIYVNSKWELLGEYKAAVDLTPYLRKSEFNNTKQEINTSLNELREAVNARVKTDGVKQLLDHVNIGSYITGQTGDTTTEQANIEGASYSKAGVMTAEMYEELRSCVHSDGTIFRDDDEVVIGRSYADDREAGDELSIPAADSSYAGVMTADMYKKLSGIAPGATADRALTSEEILSVLN